MQGNDYIKLENLVFCTRAILVSGKIKASGLGSVLISYTLIQIFFF